jgi:hypothetical protein
LEKPIVHPEFDLVSELRNVCIKVPLLQAIKYIPIYFKTIRELCVNKHIINKIEPTKIQFVGRSIDLTSEQIFMGMYQDPDNPIVSVHINVFLIPNTLIDLGVSINIMTLHTMEQLQLLNLHPTPIVLEL